MNVLGKRIKSLREFDNIQQNEFAKKIGVSNVVLSRYESGERKPDYETLQKIADFFDVSTDYLLGRIDEPYAHPFPLVTSQKKRAPYKHIGIEIESRIASRRLSSQSVMELLRIDNEEYISLLSGEIAPTQRQAEILGTLLDSRPERFLPEDSNEIVRVAGQEIVLSNDERKIFDELKKHPVMFHDLASDPEKKVKELIKLYKMQQMFLKDDEEEYGDEFGDLED